MRDNNYLKISCRHCKGHIEFPKEACGQEAPCPHCGKIISLRKSFQKIAVFVSVVAVVSVIISILLPKLWRGHLEKVAIEKTVTSASTSTHLESFTTEELRAKAEKGNVQAQAKLGLIYGNGRGVPVDYGEAVKWYRKAAEQGDANAQNNLGLMYKNGWGVSIDYAEAIKWYRKAAEQALPKAQFNLAIMHSGGWVAKDMAEAVKWFQKSAEQGYVEAQTTLAFYSEYGLLGVPKDVTEELKWYRKAAEHDSAEGQSGLAGMYLLGEGVPKDYIEAYKWLSLAVAQGTQGHAIKVDENTQNFPPDQIVKMQKVKAELLQRTVDVLGVLSPLMTSEQREEAHRRARAFSESR